VPDIMEHDLNRTWNGETKIVIGIDIGTTQSAVAIGLLEHGMDVSRALHSVTEWPGQDLKQAKIPSAIWYDSNGKAVSFGADTLAPNIEDQAEDSDWFLAQYFKLLLHPEELQARGNLTIERDIFRYGVTIEQVYSDFLRYLFQHTEKYFRDRIIDGDMLWSRYRSKMEFVIAHPNAWGTSQQAFLRNMAVKAGQAEYIYVDGAAKSYMQTALRNAGLSDEEDLAEYVKVGKRDFEAGVKRLFSNEDKEHYIKMGERRVSYPSASVRRGHMVLRNTVIKQFFEDCIKQIFISVDEQVQGVGASHILLVGGFGDSPYLRKEFRNRFEGRGCQVKLTESST
ncbi:unnamed protein product, partial [Rhizoctonia solani]